MKVTPQVPALPGMTPLGINPNRKPVPQGQTLGGKNGRANVHEARLEDTAAGKGTERADDFTGGD